MAYPFWVEADLAAQIGQETVDQILDDDSDGDADAAPLAWLQERSCNFVETWLRPNQGELTAIRATTPTAVKRVALDAAEWMAARRWPDYINANWMQLKADNIEELKNLREAMTRLDVVTGVATAPHNVGGLVASGDPDYPTLPDLVFNGQFSLGDF